MFLTFILLCLNRHMDDSSSIPPSHGGPTDSTSTHPNTRGPTKLKGVAAKRRSGQKLEVAFDELGRPIGEHAKVFSSYVGMLARTKVSILPLEWDDVARDVKDMIWQDLSVCKFYTELYFCLYCICILTICIVL